MLRNLFALRHGVRKLPFFLPPTDSVELVSYVQNISSSAVIFRFMKRSEDVENTVNRLRNRGELSSRHVLAAVKILNSMNQSPSLQFIQELLDSTLELKDQFQFKDLFRIFHFLQKNRINQCDQLDRLAVLLLTKGSLDSVTNNELVCLIGDLGKMKEQSGGEIPVLQGVLFEEIVRKKRLRTFQNWQLATLAESLTKFKDSSHEKVDEYLKSLIYEVSAFDRLNQFSVHELMSVIKLVEHCHFEDEATLMVFQSRITHFKTLVDISLVNLESINRALFRLEQQRRSLCNATCI